MANSEQPSMEKEKTNIVIERETGRRARELSQITIRRLEKRVQVLVAQLEEAKMELELVRPKLPQPKPLLLDAKTTAVLVLDLSTRCVDSRLPCHKLVPLVTPFLKKSRAAGIFIVYTVIHTQKGTAQGEVYPTFEARPEEPVIYPDSYNKFADGELHDLLSQKGIKTVVIVGSAANFACLYTATEAAGRYKYGVVIPVDGIVAWTPYEHHYALFQFSVLPGGVAPRFHFTELNMITFTPSSVTT